MKKKLEELLKKIKLEPLSSGLSMNEIKYLTELEYLKRESFELYVKYYNKYEQIKAHKKN